MNLCIGYAEHPTTREGYNTIYCSFSSLLITWLFQRDVVLLMNSQSTPSTLSSSLTPSLTESNFTRICPKPIKREESNGGSRNQVNTRWLSVAFLGNQSQALCSCVYPIRCVLSWPYFQSPQLRVHCSPPITSPRTPQAEEFNGRSLSNQVNSLATRGNCVKFMAENSPKSC